MDNSLYHDNICGIKAVYPLIRDSPNKAVTVECPFDHNITENDITELKRIFYGGKTHADFHLC